MTYERAPAKIGAEDMAICATFQKKKLEMKNYHSNYMKTPNGAQAIESPTLRQMK